MKVCRVTIFWVVGVVFQSVLGFPQEYAGPGETEVYNEGVPGETQGSSYGEQYEASPKVSEGEEEGYPVQPEPEEEKYVDEGESDPNISYGKHKEYNEGTPEVEEEPVLRDVAWETEGETTSNNSYAKETYPAVPLPLMTPYDGQERRGEGYEEGEEPYEIVPEEDPYAEPAKEYGETVVTSPTDTKGPYESPPTQEYDASPSTSNNYGLNEGNVETEVPSEGPHNPDGDVEDVEPYEGAPENGETYSVDNSQPAIPYSKDPEPEVAYTEMYKNSSYPESESQVTPYENSQPQDSATTYEELPTEEFKETPIYTNKANGSALPYYSPPDTDNISYSSQQTPPYNETHEEQPAKVYQPTQSQDESYSTGAHETKSNYSSLPAYPTPPETYEVPKHLYLHHLTEIAVKVKSFQESLSPAVATLSGDITGRSAVKVCLLFRMRATLTLGLETLQQSLSHWANLGTSLEDPHCRGHATKSLIVFRKEIDLVEIDLKKIPSISLGGPQPEISLNNLKRLCFSVLQRLQTDKAYYGKKV